MFSRPPAAEPCQNSLICRSKKSIADRSADITTDETADTSADSTAQRSYDEEENGPQKRELLKQEDRKISDNNLIRYNHLQYGYHDPLRDNDFRDDVVQQKGANRFLGEADLQGHIGFEGRVHGRLRDRLPVARVWPSGEVLIG
jgi:hypothetical protein